MKPRASITRRWTLADEDTLGASGIDATERSRRSDAMQAWRRLVTEASERCLVLEWDDGRDQFPWYNACRCKAERRLFLACEAALGHKAETTLDGMQRR